MNVNKPKPSANYHRPAGKSAGNATRSGTKPAKRPGGNNVVAGNTVVVGRPPAGNGYYNNGSYNNRPDWDDDLNAGVSVVSAVIGSVVNDKPSGCQPVVSGGVQYQLCDGVYYQAAPQSGPNAYQVVPPPQ